MHRLARGNFNAKSIKPKTGWTIGRRAIARLLLKGDRSSCDGTFFLKVNRCKLSLYSNAKNLPIKLIRFANTWDTQPPS